MVVNISICLCVDIKSQVKIVAKMAIRHTYWYGELCFLLGASVVIIIVHTQKTIVHEKSKGRYA